MSELLHDLILRAAERDPGARALEQADRSLDYAQLAEGVRQLASGLVACGLARAERVAVYLPKQLETVLTMFGTAAAGGAFVPVNPILKPEQVGHILRDCNVRVLVTATARAVELAAELADCHDLRVLVLTDSQAEPPQIHGVEVLAWSALLDQPAAACHRVIDMDMAAILYTSGSTGRPKGVVLSHRNMVTGASSVASYLENRSSDRLLAALPFSFDYGFSQLSTAFSVGACTVLMDYLLPRDILRALDRKAITGLAAVPPLWVQLAPLAWPESARRTLRYLTNSGGAMPRATLTQLRAALPETRIYLMYGLTEAFRSTYLPPEQVDLRPDSMGKAIPNAEVQVVREDGTACAPGEPGELVHRGSLVAMGYWNDPEMTGQRFKPAPGRDRGHTLTEIAVWSGDTVRLDDEGYLYFVGRRDEMIKTSGYRVSPTEVEEIAYGSGLIAEAAAIGVPHPVLGQAIVLAAVSKEPERQPSDELLAAFKAHLPAFMVPAHLAWRETLPRNPNGKIDRKRLAGELLDLFAEVGT